jgi:16S rRNA (cytosine967-C5)-methyltransferase
MPGRFGFATRVGSGKVSALKEIVLKIAEAVLRKSGRDHPADAVLRAELKQRRGLPKEASREVARHVFTWYRWRGWLDERLPLHKTFEQAVEFQKRYNENASGFLDADLVSRAVPGWVWSQVKANAEWIRTLQLEPKLWLRARRGQGKRLAATLGKCRIAGCPGLADAVEYQGGEDLFRSPEFQAGEFEVQDINSQVVSLICEPRSGETWWDACAGEGGKTLHLSDLMANKGLIWSSDRAEWRLKRLRLRAGRAKAFNYRSVLWDGGAKLPTKTKFDGVLVDAPCSGVGTWQRNPHARWTTTESDVRELAQVQLGLLANAANAVKPGGRLLYAVCTLTEAETEGVARAFEGGRPEFQRLPLPNPFRSGSPDRGAQGLWLWPQETGGNGMFVAAWRR